MDPQMRRPNRNTPSTSIATISQTYGRKVVNVNSRPHSKGKERKVFVLDDYNERSGDILHPTKGYRTICEKRFQASALISDVLQQREWSRRKHSLGAGVNKYDGQDVKKLRAKRGVGRPPWVWYAVKIVDKSDPHGPAEWVKIRSRRKLSKDIGFLNAQRLLHKSIPDSHFIVDYKEV